MRSLAVFALAALVVACSGESTPEAMGTAGAGGTGGSTVTSAGGGGEAGGGTGGTGGESLPSAMVRFHIFSSSVDALDGASVIDEPGVQGYVEAMNATFAVAQMQWVIESVMVQPAADEAAYLAAVAGTQNGGTALAANVDLSTLLAPNGWDVFVLKRTSDLGFGGAYRCTLDTNGGTGSPGAVFVPALAANGQPQQQRKWTHEMGHATGLPHPPCEAAFADNLMMSGSCALAEPDRTALTENQIVRIGEQLDIGAPVACGEIDPNDY